MDQFNSIQPRQVELKQDQNQQINNKNYKQFINIQDFSNQAMRPTPRVDRSTFIPLPNAQPYNPCIGITCMDSYLYIFHPNTIRVYEQFPHKVMPQLCEEFIISSGRIICFGLSYSYIAILFQDSKMEIRNRNHLQKVQFSLHLPHNAFEIKSITLKSNAITYKVAKKQSKSCSFGIIRIPNQGSNIVNTSSLQNYQQISFWKNKNEYLEVQHVFKMGKIDCLYFGFRDNRIVYGMHYKQSRNSIKNQTVSVLWDQEDKIEQDSYKELNDNDNMAILQEFQFGNIVQNIANEEQLTQLNSFQVLRFNENNEKQSKQGSLQDKKQLTYIMKIITQRDTSNSNQKVKRNKLILKFFQFYKENGDKQHQSKMMEHGMNQEQYQQEDIMAQAYKKWMGTIQQISKNLAQQNNYFLEHHLQVDESYMSHFFHQSGQSNQKYIYIRTNRKLLKCHAKTQEDGTLALKCTQIQIPSGTSLEDASQHNVYVYLPRLHVAKINDCLNAAYDDNDSQPHYHYKIKQQGINEIKEQPTYSQQKSQLDQPIQELDKQDKSLASSSSIETQTDPTEQHRENEKSLEIGIQTELYAQLQQKQQSCPSSSQPESSQGQQQKQQLLQQQQQWDEQKKQQNSQVSTNLLMPESLKYVSQMISSLPKFSNVLPQVHGFLQQQQKEFKAGMDKYINDLVVNVILPQLQVKLTHEFAVKLNQINGFLYTLAANNLMAIREDIEKDQVKQQSRRKHASQSFKYEIDKWKSSMSYMLDVCKQRELEKVAMFAQIRKIFGELTNKVQGLQKNVKSLIEGEQASQAKVFDQIQLIKSMLKQDGLLPEPVRKRSTLSRISKRQRKKSQNKLKQETQKQSEKEKQKQRKWGKEEQNENQQDQQSSQSQKQFSRWEDLTESEEQQNEKSQQNQGQYNCNDEDEQKQSSSSEMFSSASQLVTIMHKNIVHKQMMPYSNIQMSPHQGFPSVRAQNWGYPVMSSYPGWNQYPSYANPPAPYQFGYFPPPQPQFVPYQPPYQNYSYSPVSMGPQGMPFPNHQFRRSIIARGNQKQAQAMRFIESKQAFKSKDRKEKKKVKKNVQKLKKNK